MSNRVPLAESMQFNPAFYDRAASAYGEALLRIVSAPHDEAYGFGAGIASNVQGTIRRDADLVLGVPPEEVRDEVLTWISEGLTKSIQQKIDDYAESRTALALSMLKTSAVSTQDKNYKNAKGVRQVSIGEGTYVLTVDLPDAAVRLGFMSTEGDPSDRNPLEVIVSEDEVYSYITASIERGVLAAFYGSLNYIVPGDEHSAALMAALGEMFIAPLVVYRTTFGYDRGAHLYVEATDEVLHRLREKLLSVRRSQKGRSSPPEVIQQIKNYSEDMSRDNVIISAEEGSFEDMSLIEDFRLNLGQLDRIAMGDYVYALVPGHKMNWWINREIGLEVFPDEAWWDVQE